MRAAGKTFKTFLSFLDLCKAGERVQWHGPEFVVVDRETWNELQQKANRATVIKINENFNLEPAGDRAFINRDLNKENNNV